MTCAPAPESQALKAKRPAASNRREPRERRWAIRFPLDVQAIPASRPPSTLNHHRRPRKRQFLGSSRLALRLIQMVHDANRYVMAGLDPQLCNCGVWPERHFSAERNGDLDADRVSTGAEEMANFEGSA